MDKQQFARQVQLEAESLNMGVVRYRRHRSNKDETDLKPGMLLVNRSLDRMVDAIEVEVRALAEGKARRGKPSVYGRFFKELDPSVMAFITAKVCLNQCMKLNSPLVRTAVHIGTLLEEHQVFLQLRDAQPALYNSAQRKVKKATTAHHKRYTMRHSVRVAQEKHEDVRGLTWTDREKLLLGMKLIELFIEATGLVEEIKLSEGKRNRRVIRGTPETIDWLRKLHDQCELLTPIHMPTIVPPKPWTTPLDGGYYTQASRMPLIKTDHKGTIDELFSTHMPQVYDAVNTLQDTAWRINEPVLKVIQYLRDTGSTLGGLPVKDERPLPPVPPDIERMKSEDPEAFRDWKKARAEVHEANARDTSRLLALAQQVLVADKLRKEEAIYFPYQLDFRGRVYAIPTGLNPQVNDAGKAMLEFAEGVPLGEDGAFWLAVHIANLFGVDKVSLEDRVAWVHDNENELLDSAMSPLDGQRFWATADKPFCALAACFEWAGYRLTGDTYVSHLPVAMDGTCSGLQHYSALLRDPSGAAAVNLAPAAEPSDIYSVVAERVAARVDASEDPVARPWRGKVERKIVKQPCMTFAYSATVVGMRDQIVAALKKLDDTGGYLEGHDYFTQAQFLAPIVREEIRGLVRAASTAMDWLQDCTRKLNEQGQPIVWWTPLGLPVRQASMKSGSKAVRVLFQGQELQLRLQHKTSKLDTRGQVNGIAPNYIHSLDSAHLMLTVLDCAAEGITSFAMIHDSFGTHAGRVSELNYLLRRAFVDMYEENLLMNFYLEVGQQTDEPLPPLPPIGDFDLKLVMESDFFFS